MAAKAHTGKAQLRGLAYFLCFCSKDGILGNIFGQLLTHINHIPENPALFCESQPRIFNVKSKKIISQNEVNRYRE
jgi:hypothetical protein